MQNEIQMLRFNLFEKLKIVFNFRKTDKNLRKGAGGDAGKIFIAAKRIEGTGSITADGGAGNTGGKGGKIILISEDNQFDGEISAKGGKSSDL